MSRQFLANDQWFEGLTSWGEVKDATGGTATLTIPSDGRFELNAIAVVSSSGQQASGETEEPVRLLKDSEPPRVRWLLPERYWPPGVEQVGDEEPEVPIVLSPTDERQRLYLNASPVTQNQTLRLGRGMQVFDRSGFSLLGAIGDDSGLRKGGEQKAGLSAVGDLGVTVTPEDPASEEPQRIEVKNFTKGDGDQYKLRVRLEDRCGNKMEDEIHALVTIDTQKPDDYLGLGILPFQGSTPRPWGEYDYPPTMTEMNPARYASTTARDVLALWQDSTGEEQEMVGGGRFWQLRTPIALAATNGASGTASLLVMDVAGNLTGTLTLNASREVNMLMISEEGEHPVTSGLYYGPTFDEQPVLRDAPLTPRFDKMAWQKDGTTKEVSLKDNADIAKCRHCATTRGHGSGGSVVEHAMDRDGLIRFAFGGLSWMTQRPTTRSHDRRPTNPYRFVRPVRSAGGDPRRRDRGRIHRSQPDPGAGHPGDPDRCRPHRPGPDRHRQDRGVRPAGDAQARPQGQGGADPGDHADA
jgi:hypothetical protein